MQAGWSFRGALAAAALSLLAGCGGNSGPNPETPGKCGGEDRPRLSCESEFKYEGRKIEGGFSALGVGNGSAKTDETALRQIDQQTEQYVAQSRRLCDEYNACVLDKDTYATRSENLRRRMSKVPELYEGLKGAADDEARRKALAMAYQELVPDAERRELSFSLAVHAQKPSEAAASVIGGGSLLPTSTRVSFTINVSRPAYVYLFQKAPDGTLNVLFPDARIATRNPLPPSVDLRIPNGEAAFKLNERNIGTERVYVVASLEPLDSLQAAAERARAGQKPDGQLASVTTIPNNAAGCKTRALELDEGATPCVRSRGLQLEEAPASGGKASLRAQTEAADGVLVQVFSFEHTP